MPKRARYKEVSDSMPLDLTRSDFDPLTSDTLRSLPESENERSEYAPLLTSQGIRAPGRSEPLARREGQKARREGSNLGELLSP